MLDNSRAQSVISIPVVAGVLRFFDVTLLFAAVAVASEIHPFASDAIRDRDVLTAMIAAGMSAFILTRGRIYDLPGLRSFAAQAKVAGLSVTIGFITMFCFLQALQGDQAGRIWSFEWLLSATALLAFSRVVMLLVMRRWSKAGRFTRILAVIGDTDIGYGIIARATTARDYRIAGLYSDQPARTAKDTVLSEGCTEDLIERCRNERIDEIIIAVSASETDRIAALAEKLSVTVSDIYVATETANVSANLAVTGAPILIEIAKEPALLLKQRPLKGWDAVQKRALDVVLASLLLVFLVPFMAIIALAIKIDSSGPVLFRQPRFGFNNVLFKVYKFRTMHHNMTDMLADQQTKRNDKRITRVGKWLRKLSFDELPQLWNVLTGEMSLVGPRPHAPNTKAGGYRFTEIVPDYSLRHRVPPGITGWAQVNGWRGETQTVEQLEKRVACDLHYINNWSLLFDVKILFLTVLRGIASPQAY